MQNRDIIGEIALENSSMVWQVAACSSYESSATKSVILNFFSTSLGTRRNLARRTFRIDSKLFVPSEFSVRDSIETRSAYCQVYSPAASLRCFSLSASWLLSLASPSLFTLVLFLSVITALLFSRQPFLNYFEVPLGCH